MMQDNTPPLAAEIVAAEVAARLKSIGRGPDMVTQDALAALCRSCGGSRRGLQTLLTSALFLASTESAPTVTADHITRAAAMQPEPDAADPVPQRAPRPMGRPALRPGARDRLLPSSGEPPLARSAARWLGIAAAACILTVVALASWQVGPEPTPAASPQTAPPPQVQAQAEQTAPPTQPPQPQALPPLQQAAPVPPRAPVEATQAVPPHVIIDFSRYDRGAWPRANRFANALRDAGIQVQRFEAIGWAGAPAVLYYFPEDRSSAERVSILFGEGTQTLPVRQDRGPRRPPGTIRVVLPGVQQSRDVGHRARPPVSATPVLPAWIPNVLRRLRRAFAVKLDTTNHM